MRVVAMLSGGKDSCYNMMQCVAEGHEIVALANLYPKYTDELDSFMYQTVGHMGIEMIAQAMNLPLYRRETKGKTTQSGNNYVPMESDEVEDLFAILQLCKKEKHIEAVSVGAILSDYQRLRVENVCSRLGLVPLAYLWRRDQTELLQEMIDCQVDAIVIKVAALGLSPNKHLGKSLLELKPHLLEMHEKYGLNVCGEGGEYETFTLNCPLFKQRIIVENMQVVIDSENPVCSVGYINFTKLSLQSKDPSTKGDIFVKNSSNYITDINECTSDEKRGTECECIEKEASIPPIINGSREFCPIANRPLLAINPKGWLWVAGLQGCSGSLEDSMLTVMQNLRELTAVQNYELSDYCYVALYLRSMSDYQTINRIYEQTMNFENPPTRVCVELPLPKDCHVIVEAIAFRRTPLPQLLGTTELSEHSEEKQETNAYESEYEQQFRHSMHVQSISHWAPANIGPYSQSIKIGQITYISGQIALVPGSMTIIDGGIRPQCKLSLRHVSRVAEAMNGRGQLHDVVYGICFVTQFDFIVEAKQQWERRTTNAVMDYIVVPALPRNALVEWQVWTHTCNDKFENEDTNFPFEDYIISIRRRWNYQNNCAAVICYVATGLDFSTVQLTEWNEDVLKIHYNLVKNITAKQIEEILTHTVNCMFKDKPIMDRSDIEESDITDACNDAGRNNKFTISTPVVHLKVFYQATAVSSVDLLIGALKNFRTNYASTVNIVFTVLPACSLHNSQTFLSICALRHE